ncbi:hypothetical protein [Azospirillum griseum]|uniref:Uncharacterized protein n=1 Tax=Azospirillum griseum TaxID=2496639 RepID=A0A3S0KBS1_9PROT|nr:hypothetical protein [Azospirillum griseum]RTR21081.1 hypothetical protein EJ903_10115 [Azospirillum griseum]
MIALNVNEISVLEDSLYFVNRSVEALNLQMIRLENNLLEDENKFFNYVADAHFYLVALKRLQQALISSKRVPNFWIRFGLYFEIFRNEISDAVVMRNILDHIDEYIINSGRHRTVSNSTLYNYTFDEKGCLFWGDMKFNRHKFQSSAGKIVHKYREMTSEEFRLYRHNTHVGN